MTTRGARVLVFEDSTREKESLESDLLRAGVHVVGAATSADRMRELVVAVPFDVALLDVMARPRGELLGLRMGIWLRRHRPRVGVVAHTSYDSAAAAYRLLGAGPPLGVGYLVKSRIDRTAEIVHAIDAVAAGRNAIDPVLMRAMITARPPGLTPTEEETLRLVVDGWTTDEIARICGVTPGAIDARLTSIYAKLGIDGGDGRSSKRVQAVVQWLTRHEPFRTVRELPPMAWDPG